MCECICFIQSDSISNFLNNKIEYIIKYNGKCKAKIKLTTKYDVVGIDKTYTK